MLPAMTATALLLNYGAMFELIAELNKEWRMISTRLSWLMFLPSGPTNSASNAVEADPHQVAAGIVSFGLGGFIGLGSGQTAGLDWIIRDPVAWQHCFERHW